MTDQPRSGPKHKNASLAASSRRRFLQDSAATAVVAATAPHFLFGKSARTASRAVRIGFIGPRTGALAHFGESNDFVLPDLPKPLAGGIAINGTPYTTE